MIYIRKTKNSEEKYLRGTEKWRTILCSWIGRLNIDEVSSSQLDL